MPDWMIHEFQDNDWDEFAHTDDCKVPYGVDILATEEGDVNNACKKSWHEIDHVKSPKNVIIMNESVDLLLYDPEHNQDKFGIASKDVEVPFESVRSQIVSDGRMFCESGSLSGIRDPNGGKNSSHVATITASPSINNLDLLENNLLYGEKELADYPWPAIDNFEDVDRMFRYCDSTYGEDKLESMDDLARFLPPFNSSDSSEVTLSPSLPSSFSEAVVKNVGHLVSDHNKSTGVDSRFSANWMNTSEDEDIFEGKEQMAKEGKLDKLQDGKTCGTLAAHHLHQKVLTTKAKSQENFYTSQYVIGKDVKQKRNSAKEGVSSSMALENSLKAPVSFDNLEEDGFLQLQDVMNQLDIRTKLCIRDGLYRLARCAEQRQGFSSAVDCGGDSGTQNTESSYRCAELGNVERETNWIDRSIAHLLFHQPLGPATSAADDAMSFESHGPSHAPTNNPAALVELLFQGQSGDASLRNYGRT